MGRKARLKKARQQGTESNSKYDSTQFVKQFEQMGYRLKSKPQKQSDAEQFSPEIPEDKTEPQL